MAANATELYIEMLTDITSYKGEREVTDPLSPRRSKVLEALPGRSYTLRAPEFNVVGCRTVDLRWAVANTLHFFSDTEDAASLRRYNKHADKFLTGDRWLGAYGAAALPGIRACIALLRKHPNSRRAVASMPDVLGANDQNRPACWTTLHFLSGRASLDLLVYQRSLNLSGVMPYDTIVLTNILHFVACEVGFAMGSLRWFVGNLHTVDTEYGSGPRNQSCILPLDVKASPAMCSNCLETGEFPYADDTAGA